MPIAGVIGGLLGLHLGVSAIFLAAILASFQQYIIYFQKKKLKLPLFHFYL